MIPLWLSPEAALPTFQKCMSVFPVIVRSDAEQFKRARLEYDANKRTESRLVRESSPMRKYKSHCKWGHPLMMRANGRQDCPTCGNERSRKHRAKAKA